MATIIEIKRIIALIHWYILILILDKYIKYIYIYIYIYAN